MKTLSLLGAALVLHLVLVQPNHPAALSWPALTLFALELPVILLALLALGRSPAGQLVRLFVTGALTFLTVLKTADFISFMALSRGFNPVTDLSLIDAFARLLTGTLGTGLAVLVAIGSGFAVLLVAWLIWWATGVFSRLPLPNTARLCAAPLAVLAAGVMVTEIGDTMGRWDAPIALPGTRLHCPRGR